MAKTDTDNDKILAALDGIHKLLEDLFVLEASLAGVGQREIRTMLGIDQSRVTKVARHAKRQLE
jgi:DNA-directed RNA polymerase specialized sigma24 family protein